MAYIELPELARIVSEAMAIGRIAADAQPNDGGSANLDHVVLCDLKGVRESALRKVGIDARKRGVGSFALSAPFAGQGNRRAAGVEAMQNHLSKNGVRSYVHYQMD